MPQLHSWQSIRDELNRRIAERQWLPGEQLPNEKDLAQEFGCARTTVNRAMRDLADNGLIERRRKAGSQVALNPVRRATLKIPIIREEVENRGAAWHSMVTKMKQDKATDSETRSFGLDQNSPLLRMTTLHFADRTPYLLESRWINLAIMPEAAKVDFANISANEWLVQNAPFTHGDIAFSAINVSPERAALLECEPDTACFCLERTTWSGEKPVTSATLVYAPGYRMQTTI